MKASVQEVHGLLRVSGEIGDHQMGVGGNTCDSPANPRKQSNIDLIVMKIRADGQQCLRAEDLLQMQKLHVGAFLQTRVVLQNGIAVDRIVQEEGEIGIQVE